MHNNKTSTSCVTTAYNSAVLEDYDLVAPHKDDSHGRIVVSKTERNAGDVVMRSRPYAYVVHSRNRMFNCSECFERAPSLAACAKCKLVRYCGKSCQSKAWKAGHKLVCGKLGQIATEVQCPIDSSLFDEVHLLCMVVAKLANALDSEATALSTLSPGPDDVRAMESHTPPEGSERHKQDKHIAEVVSRAFKGVSMEEVAKLVSQMQCNNFSIHNDLLVEVGSGVYPPGALLNHSCQANCVISYDTVSKDQIIRCLRKIEPGEELCHSYVDIAATTATRQGKLQDAYHFVCDCPRCSGKIMDEQLEGSQVASDTKPGATVPLQELDERNKELLLRAESLYNEGMSPHLSPKLGIKTLKASYVIRSSLLHPNNLSLLQTNSSLMNLYLEDGSYAEAAVLSKACVETYEAIYGGMSTNHPMIGLQYYTLGDLLYSSGKQEEGKGALLEALKRLKISHGEEADIVQALSVQVTSMSAST